MLGLETCLIPPRDRQLNPIFNESNIFQTFSNILEYQSFSLGNVYTMNISSLELENDEFYLSDNLGKKVELNDVFLFAGHNFEQEYFSLNKKIFFCGLINGISKESKKFKFKFSNKVVFPFLILEKNIYGIFGHNTFPRNKVRNLSNNGEDIMNFLLSYNRLMNLSYSQNWQGIDDVQAELFQVWSLYNKDLRGDFHSQSDLFSLNDYFDEIVYSVMERNNEFSNYSQIRKVVLELISSGMSKGKILEKLY